MWGQTPARANPCFEPSDVGANLCVRPRVGSSLVGKDLKNPVGRHMGLPLQFLCPTSAIGGLHERYAKSTKDNKTAETGIS